MDFDNSYVKGFSTGSGTVASSAVTINTQAGEITSATADLAAGTSETFDLSNSYITSTSLVFVTVKATCTAGYVVVTEASPASGTCSVTIYNAGASACESTYKLHFLVINNS